MLEQCTTIYALWELLFPEGDMEFSMEQVNFLAFGYIASHHKNRFLRQKHTDYLTKESLYTAYRIPKANGKTRIIREPCLTLKAVQKRILQRILTPIFEKWATPACT
jgi:hypothetical protein